MSTSRSDTCLALLGPALDASYRDIADAPTPPGLLHEDNDEGEDQAGRWAGGAAPPI